MKRYFIDVREPFELADGAVPGALNIPPAELLKGAPQLAAIPKDAELVVYCRSGSRSAVAINILRGLGYRHIINGINKDRVMATYKL